jgi:hypothetical protein
MWLSAILVGATLALPPAAAAAGPGGGDDLPNSGHTSNTGGLTPTMIAGATISCDSGNNVNDISGRFTLSGTGGAGTYVVIYLTPNNGSNASPAGNVEDNEVRVDLAGRSGTVGFSLPITSGFTATNGGVLAVFAKDQDGSVFTSKSNSLNCSESIATPTPTVAPTPTPTVAPTATPEVTATPTVAPTPTATVAPTATPEVTATPTPTGTPDGEATSTPAATAAPTATPTGTVEAVTSKPRITPPATDAAVGGRGSSSTGNGLGLVLLALGGLAMAASLVRPAAKRARR